MLFAPKEIIFSDGELAMRDLIFGHAMADAITKCYDDKNIKAVSGGHHKALVEADENEMSFSFDGKELITCKFREQKENILVYDVGFPHHTNPDTGEEDLFCTQSLEELMYNKIVGFNLVCYADDMKEELEEYLKD